MSDILAANIFLHVKKQAISKDTDDLAHSLYTYTLEVKECSIVDITLDFTLESKNIQLMNSTTNILTATIMPFETRLIAIVRAYDVEWSTKCAIKIVKRAPSLTA